MNKSQTNKTLLITGDYPPPFIGGSLVYIYNLVEKSNLTIDVLTGPNSESFYSKQNIRRCRFLVSSKNPSSFQMLTMYLYLFIYFIKISLTREYSSIVFYVSAIGNGFFALLTKLLKLKLIIILFAEEITLAQKSKGLKGWLKRFGLKFYSKADAFVSICDFAKDLVLRMGVKSENICVIPTPLLLDKRNKAQKIKNNNYKNHVLSVGRIIERKGFHYLIDAITLVRNEIPDVRLTIIGDGPYRNKLEKKIKDNNLEKNVILLGEISDEELANAYKNSNLFVLANVMLKNGDCEGCPNVFVEASSYGIPVIGGIEGGASSAIIDQKTGFLINPKEVKYLSTKIILLLKNKSIAEKMGLAAFNKVKIDHDPIKAGKAFDNFITQKFQ